jgi:predicted lipoprotein with Yx(FWY)xxD motif
MHGIAVQSGQRYVNMTRNGEGMNLRMNPRSTFALLGVGLLLALTLAACGSSTSSTPTSAASTTSGAGVSTAPPATSTPTASTPVASPAASPAASASPAAAGAGSATVLVANNATLGAILTNANGLTLYTYAKDTPGKSVCNDKCATNWPPLLSDAAPTAPAGATGTFGVITRDDGSSQVTYNDMPLYTYFKDDEPGDTYGQDVGDVWYAAQASPSGTPTADSDSGDSGATTLAVANDAKLGTILTDSKGMTLYIFKKDTPGTSNCYDDCAVNWPPLIVTDAPTAPDGVTGKLGTTTRKDGKLQVTYNDEPLYYFIGDTKAGDTTGQDVGDVWYVVNP